MKWTIRNAEFKDAESIAGLSGQLGYKSDDNSVQHRLVNILDRSDNCVFIVLDGEEVIGWVHGFYALRIESDAFVEIGGLVVDENYRKLGIGKRLVEKVNEWASSKGCQKLRVRCNMLRKETHVFYESIGFRLIKGQKVFDN